VSGAKWWAVGADGTVLHFYAAPTGRQAVARFRAALVEGDHGNGWSWRDARARVRGMNPHVVEGPLTAEQARELETGWTWAETIADERSGGLVVLPSGPVTREEAVKHLGEEQTARLETRVRARYERETPA
jgi:hypothetical protein